MRRAQVITHDLRGTTGVAGRYRRSELRGLLVTAQQAFRTAPLWPLRGAREVVAWLWKRAR